MPYAKVSELPSNVPAEHAKQFLEVFNSVHAAALADKKSPAQADEKAFAQAWSVINKAKTDRDATMSDPGFGPVEKKNEDGGQVSDPTQSLRDNPNHDEKGQFSSGSIGENAHTTEEHLKAAASHVGAARQATALGLHDKAAAHLEAAHKHVDAGFAHNENKEAVGKVARDASAAANKRSLSESTEERFNENHDDKGQFSAGSGAKTGFVGNNPANEGQHPGAETQNQMGKKEESLTKDNIGPKVGDKVESIFGSKGTVVGQAGDKTKVDVGGRTELWPAAHFKRELSQSSENMEKYMSVEKRYAAELRVGDSQGDEMALVGYAARFNSQSKDLGGFRETIAPGAFTRALAMKSDVRCLFNHDANRVLGRTTAGTLTLTQDEAGLQFRCQLDPNNTEHRNLHSSVKRGDINECSFAFTPNGEQGDHWEDRKDADGKYFISRTLKDVNLFDVSAVTHPAYDNTSVAARSEAVTPEIRSIMSELVKNRVTQENIVADTTELESRITKLEGAVEEVRAMTSKHMQAIADQHTAEEAARKSAAGAHTAAAAEHTDAAAAHASAAADAQGEADRMAKCEATRGDCSIKSCRCQNVMVAARDMDDDYEDYLNIDEDDERSAKRAARKDTENRAAGDVQVRCKAVGGKNIPAGAFAAARSADDTSTWAHAVHDADHTNHAIAQRKDVPADKEADVTAKVTRAAKKFGIVTDAEKVAAEVAARAAEKEDLELRFKLAMSKPL
jgi:HK97 family phage prohead protease